MPPTMVRNGKEPAGCHHQSAKHLMFRTATHMLVGGARVHCIVWPILKRNIHQLRHCVNCQRFLTRILGTYVTQERVAAAKKYVSPQPVRWVKLRYRSLKRHLRCSAALEAFSSNLSFTVCRSTIRLHRTGPGDRDCTDDQHWCTFLAGNGTPVR